MSSRVCQVHSSGGKIILTCFFSFTVYYNGTRVEQNGDYIKLLIIIVARADPFMVYKLGLLSWTNI